MTRAFVRTATHREQGYAFTWWVMPGKIGFRTPTLPTAVAFQPSCHPPEERVKSPKRLVRRITLRERGRQTLLAWRMSAAPQGNMGK